MARVKRAIRNTAYPAEAMASLGDPERLPVPDLRTADEALVAASIRRSDHPSRPSAITGCCLVTSKTLLIAGNVPRGTPRRATHQLVCGGRFSGVHWWPDLGVHRGYADQRNQR